MFSAALKREGMQFQIIDRIPFPVFVFGTDLQAAYVNSRALTLLSQQLEHIAGKPLEHIFPSIFSPEEFESIRALCLNGGEPLRFTTKQIEVLRSDGIPVVWLDFEFEPLIGTDQKVEGLSCFLKDVTPEITSLTSRYDYLNHFFKKAPIAIVCYRGPDFIVDVANEHALSMWGKTLEQVKGKALAEIFPQINSDRMTREKHLQSVERMLKGERHMVSEVELVFSLGGVAHTGWYRFIHEPYTDASGQPIGTMAVALEITDQVVARKQLQLITDSLPYLISYVDDNRQYSLVNKAYEKWFGVDRESIQGRSLKEVVGDLAYDVELPQIEKAMSGADSHYQGWIHYSKGVRKYVDARYIPHVNEAGSVLGFVEVVSDLTEKKFYEEMRQQTDERLGLITEAINAGTFDFDIQGQVIHWSTQLKRLFGLSDEAIVTLELSRAIIHEEDRASVIANVDATRNDSSKSYRAFDYRIVRQDTGEIRWMHTRTKTYYSEIDGQLQAFRILGFSIDITDSKANEERLRKFNSELEREVELRTQELSHLNRVLAEAQKVAKVGSWEWNVKSGEISWSDEMFEIYGYNEKFVVDFERATERMSPDDARISKERKQQFIANALTSFASSGSRMYDMGPIEYAISVPDGRVKVLRNSGRIYLSADGTLDKIFGAVQDVTEMRATELELKVAVDQLEERNRDLEAFSYIASHDLKEPLRKILTFTSRLKNADAQSASEYASRINGAAERMMDLIESVLTLSQMSNSEVQFGEVDLAKVFDACSSDLEVRIRETDAIVKGSNLGVISANQGQMSQLFSNLIGNSIKFCTGKPRIEVNLESLTDTSVLSRLPGSHQACWRLSFSDNGIGFDPKYKQQIFEPFKRLHGRDAYGGTGIGLSIVKKIVERHMGVIDVESEVGKGTTFVIFLPA